MLVLIGLVLVLLGIRFWQCLPKRVQGYYLSRFGVAAASSQEPQIRSRESPIKTMIVLGSGGHTSEMMQLIKCLSYQNYQPRIFIIAETDKTSAAVTRKAINDKKGENFNNYDFIIIPRSREVAQSWVTTIWTTLRASVISLCHVARTKPDLLLCNGPGTCIPLCLSVFILRFFGLSHAKIVFCESFARVSKLSMTGFLAYYIFADRFVVHWEKLKNRYPHSEYLGVLC